MADRLAALIAGDDLLSLASSADRCASLLALVAREQTGGRTHSSASRGATPMPAPPTPRRAPGRPRKLKSGPNGRTVTLLTTLSQHPGLPLGELAKVTYGSDDETTRNRTRSLLASLKKRKPPRVRNTGPGKWEVTQE
jgi:hypothetical protein